MSEILETSIIDSSEFAKAIDSIEQQLHRSDSVDFAYANLAALVAAHEGFRHIYPSGSPERVYVDLSPSDFHDASFDGFTNWFAIQQDTLRGLDASRTTSWPSTAPSASTLRSAGKACSIGVDVEPREINVEHHGWGHRSMIVINHALIEDHGSNIGEIANSALREFCGFKSRQLNGKYDFTWNEMAGNMTCARERLNEYRWLLLFATKVPSTSGDVRRYAQGIAKTLQADQCVHPDVQVFVLNFLQQK